MRRFAPLAALVGTLLLSGCGSAGTKRSSGEGGSRTAAEIAFARTVNLRPGDAEGLVAAAPGAHAPPPTHRLPDIARLCGGGAAHADQVVELAGRALRTPPAPQPQPLSYRGESVFMRSAVFFSSSRALPRAMSLALGPMGRACLARTIELERRPPGAGSPRRGRVSVTSLPAAGLPVVVAGVRERDSEAGSHTTDFFAFFIGPRLITLIARSSPSPVPGEIERAALGQLYARAVAAARNLPAG